MPNNKVAIVTGANKGLGLALVKGLCQKFQGTVYLTSRDEERGSSACNELRKIGLNPTYHQLDVTDSESIARFLSHIRDKEIEILINNAGILFLKDSQEPKAYQAEQTIMVNFFALVNFCESMLPFIKEGGRIVNITSSSGHLSRIPSEDLRIKFKDRSLSLDSLKSLMRKYVEAVRRNEEINEGWGDSSYVISKVGVNAYTFLLHRRLASEGIIVNCVHPGYVITDMTKGAGNMTPEESAKVPLYWAIEPEGGGLYVWHDGTIVPWDGPDPRGYIDGKKL